VTVAVETPRLSALAERVGGRVVGDEDPRVAGVSHDSRRAQPGDLFAAITGFEADGHRFIPAAVEAGAVAGLVDHEGSWPVPVIVVDDVRRAIGPVAHAVAGDPTTRMRVIGITGTNGKTTTTFMTAAVLGGDEVATLGTLGARRGERVFKTGFTTPEAPDLARLFADLEREGVRSVVMEVSSHAIALERIGGIHFAAGGFTNLSPDHLDFHPTMEEYGEAKLDFFRLLREQHGFGVVNADDAWGDRFRAAGPDETWRFSESNPEAEVYAERMEIERDGTTMDVRTPRGRFTTRLSMAGRFNAANALAAAALGVGLGAEPEAVARALAEVDHVPGRYEVYRGVDITVIVDYAHTPEAIERVLLAVRDTGARRILCVFGCGGERDRTKRPEMARVAGTLAEVAILTTDNPRREPIDQIVADTIVGFDDTSARWERIDDRAAAIEHAISEAEPGDVVCVLGKGDEDHILIGNQQIPFRDRDVVQRALATRDGTT
jgi:UDP-N-acetylmuramoyl-L-alanyl-D-glutamate--2,6-diaminopimelate ligase